MKARAVLLQHIVINRVKYLLKIICRVHLNSLSTKFSDIRKSIYKNIFSQLVSWRVLQIVSLRASTVREAILKARLFRHFASRNNIVISLLRNNNSTCEKKVGNIKRIWYIANMDKECSLSLTTLRFLVKRPYFPIALETASNAMFLRGEE